MVVVLLAVCVYAVVVGAALRACVSRWLTLPSGLLLTIGLGLAVVDVLMVFLYGLVRRSTEVVWPLLILAVIALVVIGFSRRDRRAWLVGLIRPTWGDALAVVVSTAVMARLIEHGLSLWTTRIADFPTYVAYTDVWRLGSDPSSFVARYASSGYVDLAHWDKPGVTAVMLVASKVSGTGTYSLLTPLSWLMLAVLIGALASVTASIFGTRSWAAMLAGAVPAVAVVPMSRIFDAQIGQPMTAAFAAVALATVATPAVRGRPQQVALGVVAGVAVAATFATGQTLVMGSALTLLAVFVYVARRAAWRFPQIAVLGAISVVVLAIVNSPYGPLLWERVPQQLQGGIPIPLQSPVSLLGWLSDIGGQPPADDVLVQWAGLLGLGAVASGYYLCRHRESWLAIAMVAAGALNGLLIGASRGEEAYTLHKWYALSMCVVVPVVFAAIVSAATTERSKWWLAVGSLGVLGLTSAVTFESSRNATVYLTPNDVQALESSPQLQALDQVSVRTYGPTRAAELSWNMAVSLILHNPHVSTLGDSYGGPGAMNGPNLVTPPALLTAKQSAGATVLSPGVALATVDLSVADGQRVVFDQEQPDNYFRLGGSWGQLEPDGIWSTTAASQIVLMPEPDLRGRPLHITLTGTRWAAPGTERSLAVQVDSDTLGSWNFQTTRSQKMSFTVPAADNASDNGLVVLNLVTPDPVIPAQFGGTAVTPEAFYLQALEVSGK